MKRIQDGLTALAVGLAICALLMVYAPGLHHEAPAPARCTDHETCLAHFTAATAPPGTRVGVRCGIPGIAGLPVPLRSTNCSVSLRGAGLNVCLSERLVWWPAPRSRPVSSELVAVHPGADCS